MAYRFLKAIKLAKMDVGLQRAMLLSGGNH